MKIVSLCIWFEFLFCNLGQLNWGDIVVIGVCLCTGYLNSYWQVWTKLHGRDVDLEAKEEVLNYGIVQDHFLIAR